MIAAAAFLGATDVLVRWRLTSFSPIPRRRCQRQSLSASALDASHWRCHRETHSSVLEGRRPTPVQRQYPALMVISGDPGFAWPLACNSLRDAIEYAHARLCTCDDRFLAGARRHASLLRLRVVNPIDLAREGLS